MTFNPMDYSAKETMLDVVCTERTHFYEIIEKPQNWYVQTRCTEWEVRDMVGHMIDVTEGYLKRWEMARHDQAAGAVGLLVMSEQLNDVARSLRSLSRAEAISRLKLDSEAMLTIFEALTAEEWGNFNVTHPFMGPLPTFFYPAFQVMDYAVHTWDMKWGLGQKDARIDERSAGVIVPYMFILMQYTVDQNVASGLDSSFGIKVDGAWGGQWHVTVKDGVFSYAPVDNLEGMQALFHFANASDFVLTSFQRFPGGEATGNQETIDKVRNMFFKI